MTGRILVIEDEKAMRLLIQEYLEFLGYEVLLAPDGETALEVARQHSFALALVDINLPDINGVDVMRQFRNLGIESRLVVVSGNLRESYADRIADLDVSAVLEKPVDLCELEAVLKSCLEVELGNGTATGSS